MINEPPYSKSGMLSASQVTLVNDANFIDELFTKLDKPVDHAREVRKEAVRSHLGVSQ